VCIQHMITTDMLLDTKWRMLQYIVARQVWLLCSCREIDVAAVATMVAVEGSGAFVMAT